MKPIIILLLAFALLLLRVLPAEAAFCRTTAEHRICILEIKRSAKNYWEYRAAISIDGQTRPIEVYNCRERVRVLANGVVPFVANGAGELICRTVYRA